MKAQLKAKSKAQAQAQAEAEAQSKKPRGRPPKKSIGPTETHNENVNLDLGKQSAMDETSPAPVPKKRGRKPKNSLAAASAATESPPPAAAKQPDEKTPTKTSEVIDDDTNKNNEQKKLDDKSDANDTIDANDTSDANDSIEKTEKPPKLSLSERKLARKAETEAIIASGGRGKRTPKPNPRYLDEPAALASGNKLQKDELDPAEHAAGEEGDDEMNQSSDERRNEGPLKKRMLQKVGIKSGPGRKPGKSTPGRKPGSGAAAGFKRKLEAEIDIDDDHGRKLFLDAKRRFQNSPSGSDDDAQLKKSKSPITDALAAKLRSKYPNDITVKRTVAVENKISPINRARQQLEKSKLAVEKKDGAAELRKRKLTEDTETSEDDLGLARGTSDQETLSQKNINRRKTQHTKILSDDKVVRASPSSSSSSAPISAQYVRKPIGVITKQINKSPLAQNQLTQIRSQGATKTYSIVPQSRVISSGSNKPAILRQPPRILNSSLCKPTNKATVPSFVTKVVTKDDYEHELNKKRNNNIISSRSKENNVTSYVYTEKDGKIIPKKTVSQQISPQQKLIQQRKTVLPVVRTPATQQRIISEPVSMNITNSRRVRKITCFETWYVIKMVDEQPKPEKSILSLSLMQIGNEIKKIELPSSEWSYKILLQPLHKPLLDFRKTKATEKLADAKSKANAGESKKEAAKNENDANADEKQNDTNDDNKSAVKEEDTSETKTDASEKPKDDKVTEESAGDDKTDVKSEEEKPETGSTETPKDEKSTEKSAGKDQKRKQPKKEDIKAEKADPKSKLRSRTQDSTETESSDTSAKEQAEENKSDDAVKSESEGTKEVNTEEKPSESSSSHDVYTGEVHDPNINPDERHNYRPINITFRRKCQNPQIRIQFDRIVILKNQTFFLNIDGKNVRLVASPQSVETYDDIQMLLQIVDQINLSNCCVEPISHNS